MQFNYITCSDNTIRVFKPEWEADMFEVYTKEEFQKLKELSRRIGIIFVELEFNDE